MAPRVHVSPEAIRKIFEILIVLLLLSAIVEWGLSFTVKGKAPLRRQLSYASTRDLPSKSPEEASFYEKVFASRNLFRVAVLEKIAPITSQINNVAKNIRLIGLVESDIQEAILKDEETKTSYIVREGSEVGPLTVKTIKAKSIVLGYGSEEKEIFIQ